MPYPPSHFGIHTFFCCLHAQVKHSLIAALFCARSRPLFDSVFDTRNARASCASASYLPRCCRRIARYVPWIFVFANANIACVERDAHTHVDIADSCLISSAALHRVHHLTRHGIYVGDGCPRLDVGWPGVFDARARTATVRKDIFPGHPQYSAVRGSGCIDLDKARCHAGDRTGACSEGWSFLYDPSGEVECPPGVERVGWSPLTTAVRLGRGRRHR